jgi:hypothetical protein
MRRLLLLGGRRGGVGRRLLLRGWRGHVRGRLLLLRGWRARRGRGLLGSRRLRMNLLLLLPRAGRH